MKLRTGLLMLAATGALWAQSAPTSASAKPAAKAPAQTSAKPSTTTAAKPADAKAAAKPSTKKTGSSTAAAKPAAGPEEKEAKETHVGASRRDPFLSPIQTHSNEPINCGSGKRCLVVDQTALQGIVKGPGGMIAVVSNPSNKAYFLRENDPVYNGFVVRITPDSVVFREQVTDKFGKKSTREIVKKVNAPVV